MHKDTRRLFFALEFTQEVRAATADLAERLRKAAHFTPCRIVWVEPANYHLTLYFLGELTQQTADALAADLAQSAAALEPFLLDLRHVSTFPAEGRQPPRVLWVGIHQAPTGLMAARQLCASMIARAGLPVPQQDFSPHLTLARFKSTKGVHAFRKMLEGYQFTKLGKSEVTRIVLMESLTGKGPATYVPFATGDFSPARN